MKVPIPITLNPQAPDLSQQIATIPGTSGIYALIISDGPAHLAFSANLPRRLARLLISPHTMAESLIARIRKNLARVECWPTGSRLETSLVMYELAKLYFPREHRKHLRLRMPWFVGLTSLQPFPRLVVVNRIWERREPLYGPFPTRELAQRYEHEVLALFQIRKCGDPLIPHPDHPGCIYGEMNQCLRPCQCAVTQEEYADEARRVFEFLASNGGSANAVLAVARDRACEETDFEQAALIHKRIEKVNAASALRDEVIGEVHEFNGLALTPGIEKRQFRFWLMLQGFWQEPITLDFNNENRPGMSLDQELRERLTGATQVIRKEGKQVEHLAVFSRWYFSSWRDGHWFPFRTLADLNYRRLVREISKMAKSPSGNPI